MAMFYICWGSPPDRPKCKHIPVWLPDRRLWTPPVPRVSRVAGLRERIRDAGSALFGPRPHPWRGVDAGLMRETRRDMAVLAAMDTLAESFSTGLRATVQGSVREVAGKILLPAGVEASLGG